MMRIECEAYDLQTLIQGITSDRAELAALRDKTYTQADRIGELQDQLMRAEQRALHANNPNLISDVRELVVACCRGYAPNEHCNKIGAIKVIRQLCGLGLKEAKDLFEECQPLETKAK